MYIVIKGIASSDVYYVMQCNGWQAFSWQIESHTAHQHLQYNNNSSDESKETRNGGTLTVFCDGHFTTTHRLNIIRGSPEFLSFDYFFSVRYSLLALKRKGCSISILIWAPLIKRVKNDHPFFRFISVVLVYFQLDMTKANRVDKPCEGLPRW